MLLISAGGPFCLFSAGYDISLYLLSGILPSTVVTSVSVFLSLALVIVAAQARVSLVEDDISLVTDKVIDSQALEEDADEVNWQRT